LARDKVSKGSDTAFPFLLDDIQRKDVPLFLSNIYAFKYEQNPASVQCLVGDIVDLHDAIR
jgi:hypothetical protein